MYLEYVVLFIINIPIRRAETNARHRCNCAVSENPPKLLTNARIRTKYFVSNALLMLPSEYILSLLFIVVYCVTCHANSGDEFSSEFHLLNSKLPTHLRNQFPSVSFFRSFVFLFFLFHQRRTNRKRLTAFVDYKLNRYKYAFCDLVHLNGWHLILLNFSCSTATQAKHPVND